MWICLRSSGGFILQLASQQEGGTSGGRARTPVDSLFPTVFRSDSLVLVSGVAIGGSPVIATQDKKKRGCNGSGGAKFCQYLNSQDLGTVHGVPQNTSG